MANRDNPHDPVLKILHLPGGRTAHILKRSTYEKALEAANKRLAEINLPEID
ncbi:MAG: hypothetical protein ACLFR0_00660 [Alphaproteobacteria bacterium]